MAQEKQNGSEIIKNETSGCFGGGGVLIALGFMNAERRADKDEKWNHFGPTWSIVYAIWAHTGFRRCDPVGVSRCIWRNRNNLKTKRIF